MTELRSAPEALTRTEARAAYRAALPVLGALEAAGHEAWLVGGGIRDLLLGRPVVDWDVATSAPPETLLALWPGAVPTGIRHGTVTVFHEGTGIEVTTFRAEGPYSDGRRPDWVRFGTTLAGDLERRDFTVNALALHPGSGRFADFHGGLEDLAARRLRAVGNPAARFREDALRLLRAVRFAATLEFAVEPRTEAAMASERAGLARVSAERVREELRKLLAAPRPSLGFRLMQRTGILGVILPELEEGVGVSQNRYHAHSVFEHVLHAVDAAPAGDPLVRWAALLHDVGKPRTRREGPDGEATFYNHEVLGADLAAEILDRLRCSREFRDAVRLLLREHMFHYTPEWSDAAVRRFLKRVGPEQVPALFRLRAADDAGAGTGKDSSAALRELGDRIAGILARQEALEVRDLAVSGEDVMAACGLRPGPEVGAVLGALLEAVLEDPRRNTREKLLALARERRPTS